MPTADNDQWLDLVRQAWAARVKMFGLKGQRREKEMVAFMAGVLATAVASGLMDSERAGFVAMLVIAGRGQEFLAIRQPDKSRASGNVQHTEE